MYSGKIEVAWNPSGAVPSMKTGAVLASGAHRMAGREKSGE